MLVEVFSQLLRDHSQTMNYLASLCFNFYFALVKNRYEIVQISHKINNKKNLSNIIFSCQSSHFCTEKRNTKTVRT